MLSRAPPAKAAPFRLNIISIIARPRRGLRKALDDKHSVETAEGE
jgi:hypothetical protein